MVRRSEGQKNQAEQQDGSNAGEAQQKLVAVTLNLAVVKAAALSLGVLDHGRDMAGVELFGKWVNRRRNPHHQTCKPLESLNRLWSISVFIPTRLVTIW